MKLRNPISFTLPKSLSACWTSFVFGMGNFFYVPPHVKTQDEIKEEFYKRTDYMWAGASLSSGSFSNINKERENNIYRRMDKVAKEIGYTNFKLERYIR